MRNGRTRLLSRADVERLLTPQACMDAVEDAFRRHALGETQPPGILGMHVRDGSFHVKAARLDDYFAAKLNANFPGNPARGLPTIQGVVVLSDARDGRLLALMDSMAITALRTAAATAVAHATVVTDLTSQASVIGDLHHALRAGNMAVEDVHAELGEAVAGKKRGRASDEEIIVFDSTGTGLQDVAAAIATYRQALHAHAGTQFTFY